MARKNINATAIQRVENHEKLCRIMQKQTFDQIKEMKERVCRLERVLIGGLFAIFLTLLQVTSE
tara:strand:- start:1066 stop:1257 length:192 start_codon:yes stop_codon:yes gene_type:complete